MYPAKSVIVFTTLSGAGYGLLFALIFGQLTGLYQPDLQLEMTALAIAFTMITLGLLSSSLHLGHPERAWRALSQWRSSWLSREACSALFTYVPFIIYVYSRNLQESNEQLQLWSGILTALMSLTTVFTTSMIYRTIKAVPYWYNIYVTPVYLIFSLASGLVFLNLVLHIDNNASVQVNNLALVTCIAAILLKRGYWRSIGRAKPVSTIESATGLGQFGKVQVLEQPHSHQNYLMEEMGYQIARKHKTKLRHYFQVLWITSILCLGLAMVFTVAMGTFFAVIACLSLAVAILVERWLFFAEAKHDQALYYGQ